MNGNNRWLLVVFVLVLFSKASGGAEPPQLSAPALAPHETPKPAPIGEVIPEWQARWELARLLSYTKRYGESIVEYRRVLQEKPGLVNIQLELASVLSWAGRVDEAMQMLQQVPQDNLGVAEQMTLADIFIASKEYVAAQGLLQEVLEADPANDQARFRLAELLSWMKQYQQALPLYETILAHRPDDIQVRRKYAFVLIWAGQRDQAIRQLQQSLGE